MRCRAYPKGDPDLACVYDDKRPEDAARAYANGEEDADCPYDIVVEPVDDEARDGGGWHSDDAGLFLVFRAEPPEPQPWTVRGINGRR